MTFCALLGLLTASASDFTLDIFGNANMDDTIDELDIEYVQGIIDGVNEPTQFADANYDGMIDERDIAQIELIIAGEEKTLTFIDDVGKITTVSKPLERIIPTYYTIGTAILVLGAEDRVVGVDEHIRQFPRYFPSLSKKPSVGMAHGSDLDAERVLELKPDAVFLGNMYYAPNLEDQLKGTGIDIVRVMPYDLKTLRLKITKLGYILDEEENAQEYLQWHDALIDQIDKRVSEISEDEMVRAIWIRSSGATDTTHGTCTDFLESGAQHGTPEHDVIVKAGGKNIASDLKGRYVQVEIEWVIEQNPDFIIGHTFDQPADYETDDASVFKTWYEKILATPGYDTILAVENDNVHVMSHQIVRGLSSPVSIAYLARSFYPNLFEDLDPQAVHQEYLTRFLGLDFELDTQGVFFYPPPEV